MTRHPEDDRDTTLGFYISHHILRKLRRNRNLTQDQLQEMFGVARRSTINNWETGKRRIPRKQEEEIFSRLGASPEEMGKILLEIACEEFGFQDTQRPARRPLERVEDLLDRDCEQFPEWRRCDFQRRLHHLENLDLQIRSEVATLEEAVHHSIAESCEPEPESPHSNLHTDENAKPPERRASADASKIEEENGADGSLDP